MFHKDLGSHVLYFFLFSQLSKEAMALINSDGVVSTFFMCQSSVTVGDNWSSVINHFLCQVIIFCWCYIIFWVF